MVKKKVSKTKRIKLSEVPMNPQNGLPTNPYPPTMPPQANSAAPNNNGLAPNFRPGPDLPVNPRTGASYPAQTPFPAAYGASASSPTGNSVPTPEQQTASSFQSGIKTQTRAIGNSGTQIFGGYFSEEYLRELYGRNGAKKWDEMRRSEAQISMLLNAVINPIKAANWDFEPYSQEPEHLLHCELVKRELFERIDWNQFKHEMLTFLPFGFSLFEVVHQVNFDDAKFGTYNGLKALAYRSQKTIENWMLEPQTGKLLGVNQYTYSDLGGNQFIPGDFCLVFTHSKEGDNYEGISVLRPMIGAYMRKEMYLKLAAIGIEKYAVGTPIATVPKGKERTKEFSDFQATLENYTSHECAYIMLPEGWSIDIQKDSFDAEKIKELLIFENTEFANAMVANFLALGMNGGGGAYALGSNLGEFFTTGIQSYADLGCDVINRKISPDLVKLNFGPQAGYPKLKCTGISDKAGKELAETIKSLADSRCLDPDSPLKDWLRKQYKMPKADPSTAVALPAIPAGAAQNYPKPNDPVVNPITGKIEPFNPQQLAPTNAAPAPGQSKPTAPKGAMQFAESQGYNKQFDRNKAKLKLLMQNNLESLFSGLKDALRKKYASLSGSDKILAAKGLETPGLASYKTALRNQLAEFADQAIQQARKKVPSKSNVKLSEGDYNSLPPYIRNLIDTQASLIAETQAADIEKSVFFTFTSSATASDDIDTIMSDVDNAVDPTSASGMNVDAAAGDAIAHVVNESSMSFFLDPDVSDDIESFTFTNEDPVSEICIAMVGTTVAPGDPILDQYGCPLHHNCKSRWVPNLKKDSDNPEIGSGDAQSNGGLSLSKKALNSITLSEGTLNANARKHIAESNFAVPSERKFPIHDISHARNALARASGTKYEAQVRAAVYKKYPSLKEHAEERSK